MADNLLISPDKVLNFTQLGVNFPADDVRNAILYAQRTIIFRRLGRVLYDRLQTDIDTNTTPLVPGSAFTGAYQTLVDDYVQDLLLQSSFYELQAISFARPASNGFVQPNATPASSSAAETVYNAKRKITEEKVNFFDKRLSEYLFANRALYPELVAATTLDSDRPDFIVTNSINPIYTSRSSAADEFFAEYPNTRIYTEPKRRY